MKNEIIGREAEKRLLERLSHSREPELLAIYGRRRVGKTHLIRNYFQDAALYFEVTGQQNATQPEQLESFAYAFGRAFLAGHELAPPPSWGSALKSLATEIDRRKPRGKIVLFFDEVPWLHSRRSGFLQALDHFWNSWGSRRRDLLVVICGSAASWMINRVIHHQGGLHNRVTARIRLLPFTLCEVEDYLRSRRISVDRKQILELYMAIGGVPHYLRQIEKGRSAAENIDRICFTKDGLLADEFKRLYASLFENSEKHVRVVNALSTRRRGLTRAEILKSIGRKSGGGITTLLEALEESGFISRSVPFGKRANEALYRLVDEYSLFYLTFVQHAPNGVFTGSPSGYWLRLRRERAWQSWAGCTFESICQKHAEQIKMALGIHGISTTESSWYQRADSEQGKGAQIDLLIDRSDNCISLCEIKHADSEFTLTKSDAVALRHKRDLFERVTGTRKTIFIVLVTTHGVRPNRHSEELVSQQVTLDALFRQS